MVKNIFYVKTKFDPDSWSIQQCFFFLLSHAAMRRKTHWLTQVSQIDKLNRWTLQAYVQIWSKLLQYNKSLQKNFPLKSGFCLACLERNSYFWVETSF